MKIVIVYYLKRNFYIILRNCKHKYLLFPDHVNSKALKATKIMKITYKSIIPVLSNENI